MQLKAQLHPIWVQMQPWVYWKFVEEPDFGPGPPIHTIFFMTDLKMESALPSGFVFSFLMFFCRDAHVFLSRCSRWLGVVLYEVFQVWGSGSILEVHGIYSWQEETQGHYELDPWPLIPFLPIFHKVYSIGSSLIWKLRWKLLASSCIWLHCSSSSFHLSCQLWVAQAN